MGEGAREAGRNLHPDARASTLECGQLSDPVRVMGGGGCGGSSVPRILHQAE